MYGVCSLSFGICFALHLQLLATNLKSSNSSGCVIGKKCDVRIESEVLALFAEIKKELGGVDVCVNNAGLAFEGRMMEQLTEDWKAMLEVNCYLLICNFDVHLS